MSAEPSVTSVRASSRVKRRIAFLLEDELYVAATEAAATGTHSAVLFTSGGSAKVSPCPGEAMVGINVEEMPESHSLVQHGW